MKTEQQQELLREAYSRLRIWQDGCKEYHDRAKESRAIVALQDPKQDEGKKTRKPTVQLQTLKSTFNNCVADQMDNIPEAVMIPERADLQNVADDLTDVVRHIMSLNNYESIHRRRVEDCLCTGTSITQIMWDQDMDGGHGNVAVFRVPVESFLWDPQSENIQDGRAVFKISWHPMAWYKEHYPDVYEEIGSDEGEFTGLGISEAQEQNRAADEDRAMLVEYWTRHYDAKKHRYRVDVAYLAGGAVLEEHTDVYRHGMYPFVIDLFNTIEGVPVGEGMVQELAPMMRYINRYADYIDMNLRMASKGRLLIDRNAGIDREDVEDWERDIIEGDRIDPSAIQWLQTQPFTGMVTQQMMQLQTDIKQDSGQSQWARGETSSGVTAASAISALQEAGGKITRLHTNVFSQGFKAIVEQVMWLVNQFYSRDKVLFVTGRLNEEQRLVDASPNHLFGGVTGALPAPTYTVQVQVNRRNPLRVQAQNELFMQAYSMSAQAGQNFPLSVLFSIMSYDSKDRLVPEIRKVEGLTEQIRAVSQQNEQLMAQNEELQRTVQNLKDANAALMDETDDGQIPADAPIQPGIGEETNMM